MTLKKVHFYYIAQDKLHMWFLWLYIWWSGWVRKYVKKKQKTKPRAHLYFRSYSY